MKNVDIALAKCEVEFYELRDSKSLVAPAVCDMWSDHLRSIRLQNDSIVKELILNQCLDFFKNLQGYDYTDLMVEISPFVGK